MGATQPLNCRTRSDAFQTCQGAEHCVLLIKADDFGEYPFVTRCLDLAQVAYPGLGQPTLQQHAIDPQYPTTNGHR
jgi:hypothetical protein